MLLVGALLTTGCGLPTIPFLPAPINPRIEGTNPENAELTFQHNPDADSDDLQGYVLYYKLYRRGAAAIAADEDFIARTPTEPGSRRLEQRGFVRPVVTTIRNPGQGSYSEVVEAPSPPLPLDPTANAIEFRLDLRLPGSRETQAYFDQDLNDNSFEQAEIVVTWQRGASIFQRGLRRRNVNTVFEPDPLDTFEGFWNGSAYDASDYDIARMIPDYADDPVTNFEIVLYAITQGSDAENNFNAYFSEPLRLEPAEIAAGG